ncbi:hypothetical protein ACWIUD_03625 [Helicobacter sp. 23-1044]
MWRGFWNEILRFGADSAIFFARDSAKIILDSAFFFARFCDSQNLFLFLRFFASLANPMDCHDLPLASLAMTDFLDLR